MTQNAWVLEGGDKGTTVLARFSMIGEDLNWRRKVASAGTPLASSPSAHDCS
jgi:hypothetical protein